MLYQPKEVEFNLEGNCFKTMDSNFKALMKCDTEAQERGTLVGRVLRHQIADGYAWYQVVEERPKTCIIEVCRGLGDDWVLPAWGERASIKKSIVKSFLEWEEKMKKLFSKKDEGK
jgi:hypothetical protein